MKNYLLKIQNQKNKMKIFSLLLIIISCLNACQYKKSVKHYPLSVPPILLEEQPEIAESFAPAK